MRFFLGSFFIFFSSIIFADSTLSVAVAVKSMDYKEYKDQVLLDSESSNNIVGVDIRYDIAKEYDIGSILFHIDYRFFYGTSDYVGALLNSTDGYGSYKSTTTNTISSLELLMEYAKTNKSYLYHIGGGIGSYIWERTLSKTQNEIYSWIPLIARAGVTWYQKNGIILDGTLSYKYGLDPTMEIEGSGYIFSLSKEEQYLLSLSTTYPITDAYRLTFSYEFCIQKIAESNKIIVDNYMLYEPQSTDYQHMISIGISYGF